MNNTNFTRVLTFRLLAIGFIVYTLADLCLDYFKGGPEAPSLLLILLSTLVLGGGAVFIAIVTWKEWKKSKAQEEPEEEQLPPGE